MISDLSLASLSSNEHIISLEGSYEVLECQSDWNRKLAFPNTLRIKKVLFSMPPRKFGK